MLGPAQKRDLKLEKLHENGERVAMVMSTLMYVDVVDKDDDADDDDADDDDVADVTHVADDADDTDVADVADVADEDEWWWFLVVDIQCLVFLMSETKKKLAPRYKVHIDEAWQRRTEALADPNAPRFFDGKMLFFWP